MEEMLASGIISSKLTLQGFKMVCFWDIHSSAVLWCAMLLNLRKTMEAMKVESTGRLTFGPMINWGIVSWVLRECLRQEIACPLTYCCGVEGWQVKIQRKQNNRNVEETTECNDAI